MTGVSDRHKDIAPPVWDGRERRTASARPVLSSESGRIAKEPGRSSEPERRKRHLRPVWILLLFLLPCLALTFYYVV